MKNLIAPKPQNETKVIAVCCTCDQAVKFSSSEVQGYDIHQGNHILLCKACKYLFKSFNELMMGEEDEVLSLDTMRWAVQKHKSDSILYGGCWSEVEPSEYPKYFLEVSWLYNKRIILDLHPPTKNPNFLTDIKEVSIDAVVRNQ